MTSKLHETSNVTQALFCTANKAINIQSSITFVNHAALFNNNCVSSDEGDFHLSGLVIASLESNSLNKSPYKVRTILDSGAGTNFISETILPHIKHEYLATKTLQVTGINSSEHKEFKLVRVFISKQYSPDMQIKCYTLPNILKYKVDVNQYKSLFLDYPNEFKNPLLGAADHGDGIGLVLGPGSIRDISVSNPQYQGSYLVDFTIFGPAVSGRLPTGNQLLSTYGVIQSYNTLLGETDDQVTFSPDSDIDSKLDLLQGLEFMHDKEQNPKSCIIMIYYAFRNSRRLFIMIRILRNTLHLYLLILRNTLCLQMSIRPSEGLKPFRESFSRIETMV